MMFFRKILLVVLLQVSVCSSPSLCTLSEETEPSLISRALHQSRQWVQKHPYIAGAVIASAAVGVSYGTHWFTNEPAEEQCLSYCDSQLVSYDANSLISVQMLKGQIESFSQHFCAPRLSDSYFLDSSNASSSLLREVFPLWSGVESICEELPRSSDEAKYFIQFIHRILEPLQNWGNQSLEIFVNSAVRGGEIVICPTK